ncbi:MAG: sialate O-acetylesterase [Verrucomicrobiota bacterium]
MVLQRDAADPVWGWVTPGTTVTVKVYDQNSAPVQTNSAVAGVDGKWQVSVGPFGLVANNAAYSITISDGITTITLTDILIGDVWLFSGQSNMAYKVGGIPTIGIGPVLNSAQEIADSANYPAIRCFTTAQVSSFTPQTNLLPETSWQVAGSTTTSNFTAAGYFTAREIYKQQHIPIGILCSAWPGTVIQSWTGIDSLGTFADYTQSAFDRTASQAGTPDQNTVAGLYNAMIYPIAPFRIKAVEWYQGENNTGNPLQYHRLLPLLMSSWRSLFNQTNLPFIIIQLPNYLTTQTYPVETNSWAETREAQQKTVVNDSYARLVTTLDIGQGQLHPPDKQDVGVRAARAAASLVYGQNVVSQGPMLAGTNVVGTNLVCTFNNVGAGLMIGTNAVLSPAKPAAAGVPLANFAICGSDGVYYAATAVITATNQVTLSSPSVTAPVAMRYAWGINPPCNLYNKITDGVGNVTNGLPAGSLRTDQTYKINVNSGTGSGGYAFGTPVGITANTFGGETFDHWSGDTALIAGISNSTTVVTQSQVYVSVFANYRITNAPAGLTAIWQGSQAVVSWGGLSSVHYNLRRSTSLGGPYTLIATNLGNTGFVDTNAVAFNTYYYQVSATNLTGEGPVSSPAKIILGNSRDIVSYSFEGGANGPTYGIMYPPSLAGAPGVRTNNWINVNTYANAVYADGVTTFATNAAGNPVPGMSVFFNQGNGSQSCVTSAFTTNDTKLYNAYADTYGGVNSLYITNIPYALYDVYVYCYSAADPASTQVSYFTNLLTHEQRWIRNDLYTPNPASDGTGYVEAYYTTVPASASVVPAGNYVHFTDQTNSTFKIQCAGTSAISGANTLVRLKLVGFQIVQTVSMTPKKLTGNVSGNALTLSWPTDHLGWKLQVQTNTLNTGLGTNWFTVPGSDSIVSTSITLNHSNASVFYRLTYP